MPQNTVALGTFDGLHIGHKAVLNQILGKKANPIALTFDLPPKSGQNPSLIMTPNEKITALSKMGITPVVLKFSEIKNLSPSDFLEDIVKKYNPSVIASGFNFRFGKNAAGNTEFLAQFCAENGIEYRLTNAVMCGDLPVSSTRIRQCIANGEILKANEMLGRKFSFSAPVLHGDERGRVLGFPTINQAYPKGLVTPKFGVYASLTKIDNKIYSSVTDIGIRPTFETDFVISETNIFGFEGSAYGKNAEVFLVSFIRGEKKFSGLDELKAAIEEDKAKASEILNRI